MTRVEPGVEPDGGYPGPVQPMLGARLRAAAEAVHAVGMTRLAAAGFDDLRPAHFALLKFPGPHEVRPTELAERVGLRKQALNPLLNDLEVWGYVVRTADDEDRRGRIVRLTDRGFALVRLMRETLEEIEARLRERAGDSAVNEFLVVLDQIHDVAAELSGESDPVPRPSSPTQRPLLRSRA